MNNSFEEKNTPSLNTKPISAFVGDSWRLDYLVRFFEISLVCNPDFMQIEFVYVQISVELPGKIVSFMIYIWILGIIFLQMP